ncbi:MAG: hypothetical protein LBL92_01085 [Propionibacteriaceae bacterium]|jgi:hypothetical protein|nr:hypothetical protein [Propionibacteriaceae bacterium]
MSLDRTSFSLLRQGDILRLKASPTSEALGLQDECYVVLLSQTCDVVQPSKSYCLVAPVERSKNGSEFQSVRKGRNPLRIPLEDTDGRQWIADAERAFSISKNDAACFVARCASQDQGENAQMIRSRIVRAFGRFPFPDGVPPVFQKLRNRLQSKAGTGGNLGKVIDLVSDVRVEADQWENPGRRLRLYLIVPSERLISAEYADPTWSWERVIGRKFAESEVDLGLDRVCELLLANLDKDPTSSLNLWRAFGLILNQQLIKPFLNDEVIAADVRVVSDEEFTFRQFIRTESLDLEALSDNFMSTFEESK